jgi:hypothetical protein
MADGKRVVPNLFFMATKGDMFSAKQLPIFDNYVSNALA